MMLGEITPVLLKNDTVDRCVVLKREQIKLPKINSPPMLYFRHKTAISALELTTSVVAL